MGIKDLPKLERPREKAYLYGVDKLSNVELLAIIIGSGTKSNSAIDIAYTLLDRFKSLNNLSKTSLSELESVDGISRITALKISTIFELYSRFTFSKKDENDLEITPLKIYEKYEKMVNNSSQEILGLIILNRRKKVIREKLLYKGTRVEVSVSLFEIIKELLIVSGRYFYLFHNHPEGDPSPSDKDVIFTSELIKEVNKLNIKMIDHLILGEESYYSFLEGKTIYFPQ